MITPDQIHFVRLHQDAVESWQALFQGAMIRARTFRGQTATLARDAVQSLVDMGLMQPSHGGSFVLTEQGRAI